MLKDPKEDEPGKQNHARYAVTAKAPLQRWNAPTTRMHRAAFSARASPRDVRTAAYVGQPKAIEACIDIDLGPKKLSELLHLRHLFGACVGFLCDGKKGGDGRRL